MPDPVPAVAGHIVALQAAGGAVADFYDIFAGGQAIGLGATLGDSQTIAAERSRYFFPGPPVVYNSYLKTVAVQVFHWILRSW
jgi:hypothetical protein